MRPIRLGIIGLGRWAEWHLQVIATMDEARVSAVCSRSPKRAAEVARRYDVPHTYADFRVLVRDPAVDAVMVTTSEDRHCEPTLAAIEVGKPVLVEKPIAHNLEDADRMVEASRTAGVILMPGHTLRFDTRYVAVKDLIAEDQLGRLASIYARRHIPRQALSYRPTPMILRTSVHDIDLIMWYLGETPSEVHFVQSNISDAPVPETNWILLRFPSGAIASVATIGLAPSAAPGGLLAAMEVVGTKGIVHINHVDQGVTVWTDQYNRKLDLSFKAMVAGHLVGSLQNELKYFVECVTENKTPEIVTPGEARDALRVCLEALRAAGREELTAGARLEE